MTQQLRFGDWTFDSDADTVNNGRSTIQLEPQVARLLEYLLRHQNQLLTRELLLHDVWDDRIVSDDAIQRCIGILRQTLSPDNKQAYIRTVAKKGYIATFPAPGGPGSVRTGAALSSRTWAGAGLLLACLVAVLLLLSLGGLRDERQSNARPGSPVGEAQSPGASIAVLPFADLSAEQDQAYFADGVSEEILNLLAGTPGLRVIARTSSFSFKDRDTDIATIAESLKVTHVLEGSVRKSGTRIRIVAQLVDTETSAHRWSGRYDRELGDILVVQEEIAAAVATALKTNLGLRPAERPLERSIDPDAFDLYLRGLQQLQSWTRESLIDAEKAFEQSLALEPEFARAYYGLGLALLLQIIHEVRPLRENVPKLREVIARGLRQMPDNPGLISLKGQVARYDGDRVLAERYLAQALEMEPSDIWIRNLYCFLKQDLGQPAEALRIQQRTLEIDPLNPTVYVPIGFSHLDLWQTEEALAAAQRFKELNSPGNETAVVINEVMKVVLRGDYAGAIADMARALETQRSSEFLSLAAWLGIHLYTIEDRASAEQWLDRARGAASESEQWLVEMVEAYAELIEGDPVPFRAMRTDRLIHDYDYRRVEDFDMYLLADELIARGEAQRAVDVMLSIAPEWAAYKNEATLAAEEFYPASALVKSGYSSYPALHFAPFIRALQAAGDRVGAENMLSHLETLLQSRRARGLFVEEVHAAEARALRGDPDGALDALEQAERDRTIYMRWQMRLLHNGIFEEIQDHPRFLALVGRIRMEMGRQRAELAASLAGGLPTDRDRETLPAGRAHRDAD